MPQNIPQPDIANRLGLQTNSLALHWHLKLRVGASVEQKSQFLRGVRGALVLLELRGTMGGLPISRIAVVRAFPGVLRALLKSIPLDGLMASCLD